MSRLSFRQQCGRRISLPPTWFVPSQGFQGRARLRRMREEAALMLRQEQERKATEEEGAAAQLVLAFLEHAAATSTNFKDMAISALQGTGAVLRKKRLDEEMRRRVRLETMLGQWTKVERKCIELAKKRQRSMIIGELAEPSEKGPQSVTALLKDQITARKRGQGTALMSYMEDSEIDDQIKREVKTALDKTFATDRWEAPLSPSSSAPLSPLVLKRDAGSSTRA